MTAEVHVLQLDDEMLESLYWQFDARRKGYDKWRSAPQSEREAFKRVMVQFANHSIRAELTSLRKELDPDPTPAPRPAWWPRFAGFWARVWSPGR
jgi:hypothetical protein